MSAQPTDELATFAARHHLQGLTPPTLKAIAADRPGYTVEQGERFLAFQRRIDRDLLQHRAITDNRFTAWFAQGRQSLTQVRAFIVQFSVFSNQFLVAQLHKMINAETLESMRSSKEILANEIGVMFNGPRPAVGAGEDADRVGDPELVATEGSVDGGRFHFRAAHFEWLTGIAAKAGLDFDDIGKRRHGTSPTLHFCDELIRLYGSADYMTSQAASYAVENWAAAGFWDELVAGLQLFNERTDVALPLAFFTWHSRLEAQHARHTQEELEELYFTSAIDEDSFIRTGNEMLDGVAVFWDGLDAQRRLIGSGLRAA